jgi:hypothetical protein
VKNLISFQVLKAGNYRGISLSCNLRKLFELCLSNRMSGILEAKSFFSNYQAAFRSQEHGR